MSEATEPLRPVSDAGALAVIRSALGDSGALAGAGALQYKQAMRLAPVILAVLQDEGWRIMTTARTCPAASQPRAMAQQAAELLHAIAACEDHRLSSCKSPAYQAAEAAMLATVQEAYSITGDQARRALALLAELGPHDSARGTRGAGVASLVEYVLREENTA